VTTPKHLLGLMALQLLLATTASAADDSADAEIQYLLHQVGSSNCTFVRNGQRHTAERAEEHLRMKYSKGRKYIGDAEEFIDKIASNSSWTGKPYTIECANGTAEQSRSWLLVRLRDHREN
jgi:hypothetical protein